MSGEQILVQATVFLAAAVIGVPLLKRLGLSSVLGYIVAGAAIGPWALGLAGDVESVRAFAEIGIVLLLFLIGLELLPSRLWELRRAVFGFGAAQVVATGTVLGAAAWALGVTPGAAAIIGFGLALSSTAIGLQILIEKKQLSTPQGRAGFAVLLFQDLAVIPLLAVLPVLMEGPGGGAVHSAGGLSPLLTLLLLGGVVAAGRYLLRPYFRVLSEAGSQEVFTAGALLVVLAVGVFMEKLGISMALGSFVAGMLLADSEYRHEIEADIEPFKGLLLGLFFMAVGMSVNFGLIAEAPLRIAGLVVGLVALKAAVVFAIARAFGEERSSAYALAVVLSQGGEFAFVLFSMATGEKLLSAALADTLVAVVTISMLTTPFLVNLLRCLPRRDKPAAEGEAPPGDDNPVIIAGFGRFGQIVGRILATRGIPFTALDIDSEQLDFVTQFGEKVYFGDVSRLDLLRAAGADKASVLVIAIDDTEASLKCVEIVKQHFPRLKIFARARDRLHAYQLIDLGITRVWRETFHSSAEMAGRVLTELGLPESAAEESVRIFTLHDERLLRRAAAHHADRAKLIEIARAGRAELRSLFEHDRR